MTKVPKEHAKTIAVSTKMSQITVDVIDRARGKLTRSAWLHRAVLAALVSENKLVDSPPLTDDQTIKLPGIPRSEREQCEHPPARRDGRNPNLCRACGNVVGKPPTVGKPETDATPRGRQRRNTGIRRSATRKTGKTR